MKTQRHKLLMLLAAVSTIAASMMATSACYWLTYQPEEPKSLRG